jgi:hypothetical protein
MPPPFFSFWFVRIVDNAIVNPKQMAACFSHKPEGSQIALMVENGNRYG